MRLNRRFHRTAALVAGLGLALSGLAACGDAGGDDEGDATSRPRRTPTGKFEDGTRMEELADAGEIVVGVKYDQPGLGFKGATDDIPTGFDVEIAKLLVADLGIDPETDTVTWEETISDNREPYLERAGRPRAGVVLDHRRAPRGRRPGRAVHR